MTRLARIAPRFVEAIPKALEDGVFYISETYGTASHKCACGCGMRVVTPLTPTDWRVALEADGTISLAPSIGNWDYPCQSHYLIRHNRIDWAAQWSESQIGAGRAYDRARRAAYFSERSPEKRNWFTAVVRWIRNLLR